MTIISPTDPRITARHAYADADINAPSYELARFTDQIFSPDAVTELLVVSIYGDVEEKGWFARWDAQLNGLLSQSCQKAQFAATLGEQVLVDVADVLDAPGKKYVLIVGLGSINDQKASIGCGFYKLALETAEKLEAQCLVLPFFPDRGALSAIAVSGTIAVLRCRVGESVIRGKIKSVKTIKLLVSGQASTAALRSLSSCRVGLCVPCPEPSIVTEDNDSE